MTIAKDFAAKAAVAVVAAAMALSAFAPVAKAQTADELQQMINELLAQVASLQSELGQGGTTVAAGVCPYTWTRDLSQGSTGADVMKLQQFLNADADTRIAASGVGSAGMETEYYGALTAAAVSKMQVKYRADILSPANLVNPTGYFGPSSRAKANALCVAAPVVDDEDEDTTDDEDEDTTEDEDEGPVELGGEASLEDFDIDDADDSSVEEGQEDVAIAEITIQFADGDAEISRIDLSVYDSEGADSDAWDVFESISLWIDGDKIAEEDADSKSDYLGDEDNGVIRFSGLDIVGMEDEDVEITVAATIQNNLDADAIGEWTLSASSTRFFDADGVATTEDGAPVTDDTAEFDIEVEGADDELNIKTSSDDPDATTLLLQDDQKETYTVFAFDLDTDDSTNDIQINDITITATGTADIDTYVDDARLIVDGDEVDTQDVTISADSILFEFDDGDFVIDAGDRVTVEVEIDFNSLDVANEGDFIQLSLESADVDSEGADDVVADGAATGEQHTMITNGIVILADGVETDTDTIGDPASTGIFEITFEVTSYEADFYISATSSVDFTVTDSATSTYTLTSTGDEDTADVFTVAEGETETFTLKVNVTPDTAGDYRVTLNSVDYATGEGYTGTIETRELSPASSYRTGYQYIEEPA